MGNRRIWCGLGIMAVGLCAAWPFRRTWLAEEDAQALRELAAPVPLVTRPANPVRLTHVHADEPSPAMESPPALAGLHPLASSLDRSVSTRALVKVDESPQLPALAADFSAANFHPHRDPSAATLAPGDSSPALAGELNPPRPRRRYRIGKHDTLAAIAERLLGSPLHADKLLAANPGVILVPEVLPVGATIVIPDLTERAETMVRLPDNGM